MNIRIIICQTLMLLLPLFGLAQNRDITVKINNIPLDKAIEQIESVSGVFFLYNSKLINTTQRVSVNKTNAPLSEVLDAMLQNTGVLYRMEDGQVVLYTSASQSDPLLKTTTDETRKETNQSEASIMAVSPTSTATNSQQTQTIKGTVTDETGGPLSFATVALKGTRQTATTNVNGTFELASVPPRSVLVISFIGYKTQEVPLFGQTSIAVRLVPETSTLQDVIVTGYRTIAKEHATGSYTVLSNELLEQSPVANISSALRGMVPGLVGVAGSSDANGDDTRFIIRGMGTIQEQVDRDPLIVVDGFPIQSASPVETVHKTNNPFATINPNDVESVTVLKDAAATAIYGARAANGVIVITTKKGRAGEKVNVNINAFTSISSKLDLDHYYDLASPETLFWHAENHLKWDPTYNVMDPYATPTAPFITDRRRDHDMLLFEAFRRGSITQQEYDRRKTEMIALGNKGIYKDDLNKYVYRNSVHQQYNVAVRGGSTIHNYSLSAAFDKEDSYIRNTESQRTMLNFINSVKFGPKVTLNVGVNGSIENSNGVAGTANTTSFDDNFSLYFTNAMFSDPTFQLNPWTRFVDDNGNYIPHDVQDYTVYSQLLINKYGDKLPVSWFYNPIENRKYTPNTSTRFSVRVNGGLDYDITNFLKVKLAGQYERNQYMYNQLFDQESYQVRNYVNRFSTFNTDTGKYETYFPDGGMMYEAGTRYEGYMLRFQADVNKRFGDHNVTLLAGSEVSAATTDKSPGIYKYGYNKFTNAVLTSVDYVTQKANIFGVNERIPYAPSGTLDTSEDRFFSAYLDAQYTFKDRCNLTMSVRTDASNFQAIEVRDKFSPFWSVGASWLMSREKFIKEAKWISSMKLRASYGLAGVAAGKRTSSAITTVSVSPGNIRYSNNEPWNTISSRGNPTLTWEKSRTLDMGVDFNLWRDKLYGSVSYYDRYSYDVLSNASVAMISQGVSTSMFNNAAISNRGVEFSLGTNLAIVGDLKWNAILNFSYNKNELVTYKVLSTSIRPIYYAGYPLTSVWAYNIHRYTNEGYQVLIGKDGTESIATQRASTHLYDTIVAAAGDKLEDYNWTYWIGQTTPTTNLGFMNTFTYKGFTFTLKMTGKFGYLFKDRTQGGSGTGVNGYVDGILLDDAKKVWDEGYANQKTYTTVPLFNADNATTFAAGQAYLTYLILLHSYSTAVYYKGDHIRLNEVYLSYELPNRLLAKSKLVSGLKVYAQAKNLGVIWALNGKYKDPESLPGTFKPMTIFTFGLNFNFNFN